MPEDPPAHPPSPATAFGPRLLAALQRRTDRFSPTTRALLWSSGAGLLFCVLNAIARSLTLHMHPMQGQLLRYAFGVVVMLPLLWRAGLRAYWPNRVGGQFFRGALHAAGLTMWFMALPRIPLVDMTAIGFTGPIFIMIGAYLFLGEPMRWERWLATGIGLVGVLIVLLPKLAGDSGLLAGGAGGWHLVMLGSAPVFAASYLMTKSLTRTESTAVIVFWQALTVSLFTLPLALPVWQPLDWWPWVGFAICGLLGSIGHYCLTRSYRQADISATQSVKFLDLVWASMLGFVVFADVPAPSTLLGGALICAGTIWLARRESQAATRPEKPA